MAGERKSEDQRLNKRQSAQAIRHIKTSMIIKRLYNHAVKNEEMTPSQINAAKILLNKVLPDVKAVEHSGGLEVKAPHEIVFKVVK